MDSAPLLAHLHVHSHNCLPEVRSEMQRQSQLLERVVSLLFGKLSLCDLKNWPITEELAYDGPQGCRESDPEEGCFGRQKLQTDSCERKHIKSIWRDGITGVLLLQLPELLQIARPWHGLTLAVLSILEAYIVSRSAMSTALCTMTC